MQRLWCLALLLTTVAFAQSNGPLFWEPPDWNFPPDAKATVPKEMLKTLRVSTVGMTLEETRLDKVGQLLGGETGAKGDAGDAVHWLCVHGKDGRSDWILWLESGEIDRGYIASFQWQSLSSGARVDRRCHSLGAATAIKLGLPIKLGMTQSEVLRVLGKPSLMRGDRLIYLHEHEVTLKGVPFDSSNIVMVRVDGGRVVELRISRSRKQRLPNG
jgi:hypothetical protein